MPFHFFSSFCFSVCLFLIFPSIKALRDLIVSCALYENCLLLFNVYQAFNIRKIKNLFVVSARFCEMYFVLHILLLPLKPTKSNWKQKSPSLFSPSFLPVYSDCSISGGHSVVGIPAQVGRRRGRTPAKPEARDSPWQQRRCHQRFVHTQLLYNVAYASHVIPLLPETCSPANFVLL